MSGNACAASFSCARAGTAGKCVAATATAVATAMARRARVPIRSSPLLARERRVAALSQTVLPLIEKSALLASVLSSYGTGQATDTLVRGQHRDAERGGTNPANAARAGREPLPNPW